MAIGASAATIRGFSADYWGQSARPLVSLAFVVPLLAVYETGTLLLGSSAARNGADVWLRELLDVAGFSQYFLLPLLTCGVLIAWHHARREPWRLEGWVMPGMCLEAATWGAVLFFAARVGMSLAAGVSGEAAIVALVGESSSQEVAHRFVGFLGAGIYEELLFRLLLVPPAIACLRGAGLNRKASLLTAVVLTSIVFAAAHYRLDFTTIGLAWSWPQGEPFSPLSFAFRCAAGAALALLFAHRGFGIAVGAHAFYDVLMLLV